MRALILLTIEKSPDATQTIKDKFTLPVCIKTPVGETKIPDPMIEPTITVIPFSRLILAFKVISPPPSAGAAPPFWEFFRELTSALIL